MDTTEEVAMLVVAAAVDEAKGSMEKTVQLPQPPKIIHRSLKTLDQPNTGRISRRSSCMVRAFNISRSSCGLVIVVVVVILVVAAYLLPGYQLRLIMLK